MPDYIIGHGYTARGFTTKRAAIQAANALHRTTGIRQAVHSYRRLGQASEMYQLVYETPCSPTPSPASDAASTIGRA